MDQSLAPRPKVAAAGAAGTAATAIVALAGAFGVDFPPEAAGAIVTLAAFIAGYITTERRP